MAEAVAHVRAHRPEVVVLDPRLPEVSDGMALIRRLRAMDPGVRILAVGSSPDLEQATWAGADGFVRKTFKPGDLADAIAGCMDSGSPTTSTPPDPAPPARPPCNPPSGPFPAAERA